MSGDFRAGQRVRLKSNPSRCGVLSGERTGSDASPRWQVVFSDKTDFVPGLALDVIPQEGSNPFEDMRRLRFAPARELRAALTHARLGGKLSDLIYSLYTTNTDFYAYQFKPVLSFLDSPSRGILIADEVGLGKTIEAGLIWTELRSREDARRLLVVCPAMLREKWQQELADRFGVDARLCNAEETVDLLEQASRNPRAAFAAIASTQGLRSLASSAEDDEGADDTPGGRLRRLVEDGTGEAAPLDLVIVDEAHYMRNPETQTARLGQMLRRVADNLVLLSATPVHLRNSDLFHLLNLVDSDSFPHEWSFDEAVQENAPLVALRDMLLRTPADIAGIQKGFADLAESAVAQRSETLQHLLASHVDTATLSAAKHRLDLAERLDRVNPIGKVVTRTRKRDVQERRVVRHPIAVQAAMNPVEVEFYRQVTQAVRGYCQQLDIGEGFLLTIPQRQMCSSMAAACRSWSTRSESLDDEIDQILWEAFGDEDASGERKARPNAKNLIAQLAMIAHEVGDFAALRREDSKFACLRASLFEYWRQNPGAKVVLFAYFRDTLRYLEERFSEEGIAAVLLMGGMDKQQALRRFSSPDGPRILLASEVASEGIDLQFSSLLVNYDLPWNPMRIEQRIGRIDRIGQRAEKIIILNIFQKDTLDERVYVRLFDRLKIFENALGGVEGVLGDLVREMSFDLLRHQLSEEDEFAVIEQTAMAVLAKTRIEEQLEQEAGRLVAHGDYLQQRIAAARNLNRYVTDTDLHAYVSDFIDGHCASGSLVKVNQDQPAVWEVDLGPAMRADFAEFLESERLQGRSRLASTVSGTTRCVFENVLRRSSIDIESISQYHPLVSFIRRRLDAQERYRHPAVVSIRITARGDGGQSPSHYVFAISRWSLHGENESERLAFEVRNLSTGEQLAPEESERLVTYAALSGQPWPGAPGRLDGAVVGSAFESVMDSLEQRYTSTMATAERENRDRVAFQLDQVDRNESREISRLQELIQLLRIRRKTRTIKANEGRVRRARERAEESRVRLKARQDLRHESGLVCAGVIWVEG